MDREHGLGFGQAPVGGGNEIAQGEGVARSDGQIVGQPGMDENLVVGEIDGETGGREGGDERVGDGVG